MRAPRQQPSFKTILCFRSVYFPQDAPEVLFRCIKDSQLVQILGEDPYTVQQLLNNAERLLLQCGLYTRDFEDWDCKIAADKILTNLKTFVQEWYMPCLNATSVTSGTQGYVQNAFTALHKESDDEDDDVQTVITQMAALTTQRQRAATTAEESSALVAAAINQLNANQQAMQQQFAAFTTQRNTTYQPAHAVQPPITQFLYQILQRSIQQEGEVADVEDMDVAVMQILQTQEDATYTHHLQILLNMADKTAFPPLVEEMDRVVT